MSVRSRLLLDGVLAAAFVAAYLPTMTGMPVHEWLSLLVAGPALLHLVVNWEWVWRQVASAYAEARQGRVLNFVVDCALFVAGVSVMLSGLIVSRVIAPALGGLAGSTQSIWTGVHALSADATVLLSLAHAALHWRWIGSACQKLLPSRAARPVGITPATGDDR